MCRGLEHFIYSTAALESCCVGRIEFPEVRLKICECIELGTPSTLSKHCNPVLIKCKRTHTHTHTDMYMIVVTVSSAAGVRDPCSRNIKLMVFGK